MTTIITEHSAVEEKMAESYVHEEFTAAQGADWLDENFPGWYEGISVEHLHISNGFNCICGQLQQHYGDDRVYELAGGYNEDLGFDVTPKMTYTALNEAWKYEVRKRLGQQ